MVGRTRLYSSDIVVKRASKRLQAGKVERIDKELLEGAVLAIGRSPDKPPKWALEICARRYEEYEYLCNQRPVQRALNAIWEYYITCYFQYDRFTPNVDDDPLRVPLGGTVPTLADAIRSPLNVVKLGEDTIRKAWHKEIEEARNHDTLHSGLGIYDLEFTPRGNAILLKYMRRRGVREAATRLERWRERHPRG